MTVEHWTSGRLGGDAVHHVHSRRRREVLVVVPPAGAGTTLMDVLALLEADPRISVVFTGTPHSDGAVFHGMEGYLRARECLMLPWREAMRYEFDLVLATSSHGLAGLYGKTVLLPNDLGIVDLSSVSWFVDVDRTSSNPLNRGHANHALPHALALSHQAELDVLADACPEAMPAAAIVGDICYDRLLESIPYRAHYREAFGVSKGQRLVVTTWQPELVTRLLGELPAERFRIAVTIRPNAWCAYGQWQIRAWLGDYLEAGALVIPPGEGWRAALLAADLVVGDCGPVTKYGAAIGLPAMIATSDDMEPHQDPAIDLLRRNAPLVRDDRPLVDQVRAAMVMDRSWQDEVAARITSCPGRAGEALRRLIYRSLDLREPDRAVPCTPVSSPRPIADRAWWRKQKLGTNVRWIPTDEAGCGTQCSGKYA